MGGTTQRPNFVSDTRPAWAAQLRGGFGKYCAATVAVAACRQGYPRKVIADNMPWASRRSRPKGLSHRPRLHNTHQPEAQQHTQHTTTTTTLNLADNMRTCTPSSNMRTCTPSSAPQAHHSHHPPPHWLVATNTQSLHYTSIRYPSTTCWLQSAVYCTEPHRHNQQTSKLITHDRTIGSPTAHPLPTATSSTLLATSKQNCPFFVVTKHCKGFTFRNVRPTLPY
jgi:hypothetical protein